MAYKLLIAFAAIVHAARLKNQQRVSRPEAKVTDDEQQEAKVLDNLQLGMDPNIKEMLANVQLGQDPSGPLVPSLVPKPGQIFKVRNQEANPFGNWSSIGSRDYHWKLLSVKSQSNGTIVYPAKSFATLDGSFFDFTLFDGWKTTVVKNVFNEPLFKIRFTKHIWNPTRWTWSFRITHPQTGKVLFTINKDWFGTGLLGLRNEWRIYRGHKREGKQIYYAVSGYVGYERYFHHSKADWKKGKKPVAEASQAIGRDLIGLADTYTLQVNEGEDTALLMTSTVIFDMAEEQQAKQERAKRENKAERKKEERERRAKRERQRRNRRNSQ